MDIKKILKEIQKDQPTSIDKTSARIIEPDKMARAFVKRLDQKVRDASGGRNSLILDDEIQRAIELVSMYANNDPDFSDQGDGFSLNKGLWIAGNFGSGKTILMETYRDARQKFGITCGFKTCTEMNMSFLQIDQFSQKMARFDGIKTYANKFDKIERIFDDLGEEEATVIDFGNKVCVMAHILSERYKGFRSGVKTHITTNLTMAQIKERYGGRIESRVNEMFNVILLGSKSTSKDYRKP